jgi:hypothetical protein
MSKALVLGAAALVFSAGAASAQAVYPVYGYGPHGDGYTDNNVLEPKQGVVDGRERDVSATKADITAGTTAGNLRN